MYRKSNIVGLRFVVRLQLLIILLFTFTSAFSQPTVVRGKVTDQETGRPIPFVTILFKKTPIGTTTDSLGVFKLTSKIKVDSIQFTTVGYLGKTYGIKPFTTNELQVSPSARSGENLGSDRIAQRCPCEADTESDG